MGSMSIHLLVVILQNFILMRQANMETISYRFLSFSSKNANDIIVDNNDVIYSLTSRSVFQCSTICLESLRCVSFVFNRGNLNCTLLSASTSSKTVPTGQPVQLYGKYFVRRYLEADLKSTTVSTSDRLYTFFTAPLVPRNIAKDICGLSGSYLLEIDLQAEWDSLLVHAPTGLFFTGATDEEEKGLFKWEKAGHTMMLLYTSLNTNNQTVDCIVLGKYNNLMSLLTSECTKHMMFACEKEI